MGFQFCGIGNSTNKHFTLVGQVEPGSCPALQGMAGCEWAANRLSFLSLVCAVIYNELCHSILQENWLNPYIWYLGVFRNDWVEIRFLCPTVYWDTKEK